MTAYYNEHDKFSAAWLRELIKAGHIADGVVDERSIEDVNPNELKQFTQCHFFGGIGGWSQALRLAGWPDDRPVWTGSCPCQPFSSAGKRGGTDDERHLWPAFFHLIESCRPVAVFGEQVASKDGLAWLDLVQADLEGAGYSAGAVDLCAAGVGAPHIRQRLYFVAQSKLFGRGRWDNGNPSGVRGEIQAQGRGPVGSVLEHPTLHGREPRRPEPIGRIPASGCCEGHMGHALHTGLEGQSGDGNRAGGRQEQTGSAPAASGVGAGSVADTKIERGLRGSSEVGGQASGSPCDNSDQLVSAGSFWNPCEWIPCRDGKSRPVEPATERMADGISDHLGLVRLENYPDRPHEERFIYSPLIQKGKARVGRLRGFGNAIVPQCAKEVIQAFMTL